jgi:hypothetical protein
MAARTVAEAKVPPHPEPGFEYHPEQLKLLSTGEHILMADFMREMQEKRPQ